MKPWNVLLSLFFSFMLTVFGPTLQAQPASDRFDASITNLASDISSKSRQTGVIKIAILSLSGGDSQTSAFGKILAEELTVKLFETRKFQIVERELLVKILKEQKFELSGPVDGAAIQRLGKLLAIDAILTGSITDTNVGLRINARLISSTSGEVLSVASATILKDEFVSDLLRMSFQEFGPDQHTSAAGSTTEVMVKQNGFTFEVKRFYILSERPNSIYVDILVTNLGADSELTIGDHLFSKYGRGATQVTSKDGNKFRIYDIFIGRQAITQKSLISSYRHSGIRQKFSSKQSTTITLDFNGKDASREIPVKLDLLTSSYGSDRGEFLLHLGIPKPK
ncbi:MAG TPA: FlgO family outer membrane protein [Candidatus Paceibacterota bacterium]|nr:FlgO family outer membrane protein [Candidatus Paceibacterota bacterium]